MKQRKHHYRIVDPVRFFLAVVISIMILIFAGYSIIGATQAQAAAIRTYKQVTIQDGDNLWNLVEAYNPDSHCLMLRILSSYCLSTTMIDKG